MLTFKMIIVFFGLIGMVTALVLDKMRPGMILFSVTVLFLCFGILTPKEILEGFSNKGMITVALLFLISEGVRQSGALGQLIKKLLPQEKTTVMKAQARMLPVISFVSAFLNNTPVVVIFAPIIKRWAESVCIPATKFLIPISYATILGGMCTLIGTSTNLVVDGMILDAGYKGFGMFELGRVGIFIALAGVVYLLFFSSRLLPEVRKDTVGDEHGEVDASSFHRVEAVIGARFPGINKRVGDFNFVRHYGAEVKEIKRSGVSIVDNLSRVKFRDQYAKEHGWNLIVESNMEAFNAGVGPFTHGSKVHTDLMKTQALLHGLDKYRFDAAFGGARRDEEKSRAKERIFSFRDRFHQWDPKNQRPELWDIYNAKIHKGESIRVFPLSNWTELDIWQYIRLENIPIVPLYFAKERPVVNIDGNLIMADDDRLPEEYRDRIEMKEVRFRTLGCWPLTGAVESDADTIEKIVEEMMTTTKSERTTRVIDFDQDASMEQKKREGYF